MEDGGWRMEDGGWRMEDGGWRMKGTFDTGEDALSFVEPPDLKEAKTKADCKECVSGRKIDGMQGRDRDVLFVELITSFGPKHDVGSMLLVINVPDQDFLNSGRLRRGGR